MPKSSTITVVCTSNQVPGIVSLQGKVKFFHKFTATITFERTKTISQEIENYLEKHAAERAEAYYYNFSFSEWHPDDIKRSYPKVNRVNIQVHLPLAGPPKQGEVDPSTGRWTIAMARIALVCKDIFPNLDYDQSVFFFHMQTNHSYSFKDYFKEELTKVGQFNAHLIEVQSAKSN